MVSREVNASKGMVFFKKEEQDQASLDVLDYESVPQTFGLPVAKVNTQTINLFPFFHC